MGILGIDPGLEGGFAVLSGDEIIVEPMPLSDDGRIDVKGLLGLIAHYAGEVQMAYVEKAGMRPKQSVQSAFQCGRSIGLIEGILSALGVRYQLVQSRDWSDAFPHGVTEKDKHKRYAAIKLARRAIAERIFPGIDLRKTARSTVPHEGMVDALLIAAWGRKQQQRG